MKEKLREEYFRRVRLILRTELNGKNKTEAINSLAIPTVQYSFGIIDWKYSELKNLIQRRGKFGQCMGYYTQNPMLTAFT